MELKISLGAAIALTSPVWMAGFVFTSIGCLPPTSFPGIYAGIAFLGASVILTSGLTYFFYKGSSEKLKAKEIVHVTPGSNPDGDIYQDQQL